MTIAERLDTSNLNNLGQLNGLARFWHDQGNLVREIECIEKALDINTAMRPRGASADTVANLEQRLAAARAADTP